MLGWVRLCSLSDYSFPLITVTFFPVPFALDLPYLIVPRVLFHRCDIVYLPCFINPHPISMLSFALTAMRICFFSDYSYFFLPFMYCLTLSIVVVILLSRRLIQSEREISRLIPAQY